MSERYWVYVNEPNNKALIHRSDCGHCNDGRGVAETRLAINGKWLRAKDRADAARLARSAGKAVARWCGHCANRLNIKAAI